MKRPNKYVLIGIAFMLACIASIFVIGISSKKNAVGGDIKGKVPAKDALDANILLSDASSSIEKTKRPKKSFMPKFGEAKKVEEKESKEEDKKISKNLQIGHFSKPADKQSIQQSLDLVQKSKRKEALLIPFGRLLKCELVNTIDSTNVKTPIIGLLMEPLWIDGELIFPAGMEFHGKASADKSNDRICSDERWVGVFPCNYNTNFRRSMELTGYALDREDRTGEGKTYGITDGSFGIKGFRIQSTELNELKIFAASFLESAAVALESTEPVGGIFPNSKTSPTGSNAALSGSASVLNEYIQMLKEEVKEHGFYTRVPAGKQFYLYINENIAYDGEKGTFSRVLNQTELAKIAKEERPEETLLRNIKEYLKQEESNA